MPLTGSSRVTEAPVCIVTSLGRAVDEPSRNRTVLVGLIRDSKNPMSTRFELRAPNPKSNTYLVIAASYLAILDGIKAVLAAGKGPSELEKSLSKKYGDEDFYLEETGNTEVKTTSSRISQRKERNKLFGQAPSTVWQNLTAFDRYPEKLNIFKEGDVMPEIVLESYREQTLSQWRTELHDRIIPQTMDFIRGCKKAITVMTISQTMTLKTGWRLTKSDIRLLRIRLQKSAC